MFQILWASVTVQHKWNYLIELGKNQLPAYICCELSVVFPWPACRTFQLCV